MSSFFLSGKFLLGMVDRENRKEKEREDGDIFTQDTLGGLQASRA